MKATYSLTARPRDSKGRFVKVKITSAATQRRDKYGRFVAVGKLGMAKHNPQRLRDSRGRFISSNSTKKVYRDKHGRFAKVPPVWYRRKTTFALPILLLSIIGVFYFAWQLNKPIVIEAPVAAQEVNQPTQTAPDYSKVTVVLPKSMPTRLRIAKIGVDTSFVTITKKADGTIQVPSDPFAVGWYDKGPTPGEMGPAIVVGHVDRPGGTAVFWRLRELVPGDIFEIDRADGSVVKFKVDEVKLFPQSDFPSEEVYGNLDHAGIRLITCSGTFDRQKRKYSDNLVVYGSLVVGDQTVSYTNP